MKKDTIVLLTSRSDIGGGPKHVLELAKFLKNDFALVICSPQNQPFYKDYLKLTNNYISTPHRSFSISTFFKLLILFKENPSYIFHSHGKGAGLYTKLLSLFGAKCIHTFHGVHKAENLKGKLIQLIERVLGRFIEVFICVSPDEKETSLLLGQSDQYNTQVIPNHFPVTKDLKTSHLSTFSKLGVLSRLDPHKNNELALRFFSKLTISHPNLRLIIGGDGEQMSLLKDLTEELGIAKKVSFLGEVFDIDSFFSEIDCFISTSKGEGLPYTVLEAFERGIPCLLSDVQGHRFLQRKQYLFNLDQFDSFQSAFNSLERNSSTNSKDRFYFLTQEFSLESTMIKIRSLYERKV